MTENQNIESVENQLKELDIFFSNIDDNPQNIIESIKGNDNAESVRTKLTILLASNKYNEAAELICEKEISIEWYDLAIVAFINNSSKQKAIQVVTWASKQDTNVWHRAIYLYVSNQYQKIWRNRNNQKYISRDSLTPIEIQELKELTETFQPILQIIKGTGKAINNIYKEVNAIAIRCYALLGDNTNASNYAYYSENHLELAELVLGGFISLPAGLISTLEQQYPTSLDAQKKAILLKIKHNYLDNIDFDESIKKLTSFSLTKEQAIDVFHTLKEEAMALGPKAISILEQKAPDILKDNQRMYTLFQCEMLLQKNEYEAARRILEQTKNEEDPIWLQLYSFYLSQNDPKKALEYVDKACLLVPHPELLKYSANIAFETEDYEKCIEHLKAIKEREPDNIAMLANLAAAYFKMGDYENSKKQYELLIQRKPDEIMFLLNMAICYTRLGNTAKAIGIYDIACKRKDAPLKAYLAKAYLERINAPQKAFETILSLKDIYWDNPQYLQAMLDLSYKAGREEYGHQAMLKLIELQRQGKAPQEILQAKTIEDLKIYAKNWNDKNKLLNENLLTGKFPWTMADHWQNHAAYMGWYVRTQPLGWRIEEPLTCATFSLYSTNGFRIVKGHEGATELGLIDCSPKSSDIVIDLSALITLHQLNLLDKCKDYFNKIIIPQDYLAKLLRDTDNLSDVQLTMKTSAEAIKNMVDNGGISILEDIGSPGQRPLPFVNEHTLPDKEEEHYYRLIDLLDVAYKAGKLDENKYTSLKRIAHQPSGNNDQYAALKQGQSIFVDSLTLRSICQIEPDALFQIIDTFKVYISSQDKNRITTDLLHILKQEEIKQKSNELLQIIRDDNRFIKKEYVKNSKLDIEGDYLASWLLAEQEKLPLLADDRVLQVLVLNENANIEYVSFGTDRLLMKMYEENIIDISQLSEAYLKLMEWRYRFIIPTKEILIHLAKKYKNHSPGKDLHNIALYLHDCMRDPGLFAGKEKTTRGESMAIRLFAHWIMRLIPEFLKGIWADEEFNEENAKEFTGWVIQELLPSLPKGIDPNNIIVANISGAILVSFLTLIFGINDLPRANKASQTIAEYMNMDETEYLRAVSGTIDFYGR